MSLYPRNPNSDSGKATPIATGYGATVLVALVVLIILHRAFGSVTFEGGLK